MESILLKLANEHGRVIYRPSNLMSDADIQALLTGGAITLIDETFRLVPVTSLEEVTAMANAFSVPVPNGSAALAWPGKED